LKPNFRIKTAGKDLTEAIRGRLIRLSVRDTSGIKSDAMCLELVDDPPLAWPAEGQVFDVAMGWEDKLVDLGSFATKHISCSRSPPIMKIECAAVEQNASLKSQRSQGWDSVSFADIASTIARRNGLKAAIATEFSDVRIEHEDQTESDIAFLTRLGRRFDAVIKVSSGRLTMTGTSRGTKASGDAFSPIVLTNFIRWEYSGDQTKKYTGARAYWWDEAAAEKRYVLVGEQGVVLELDYNKGSADDARRAAEAKFREVVRKGKTFSWTVPGNPEIAAERKVIARGTREGVDGEWIVKRADHILDSAGYISSGVCEVNGFREEIESELSETME
jgi:phage protein D